VPNARIARVDVSGSLVGPDHVARPDSKLLKDVVPCKKVVVAKNASWPVLAQTATTEMAHILVDTTFLLTSTTKNDVISLLLNVLDSVIY
jgi:hypothetical protein